MPATAPCDPSHRSARPSARRRSRARSSGSSRDGRISEKQTCTRRDEAEERLPVGTTRAGRNPHAVERREELDGDGGRRRSRRPALTAVRMQAYKTELKADRRWPRTSCSPASCSGRAQSQPSRSAACAGPATCGCWRGAPPSVWLRRRPCPGAQTSRRIGAPDRRWIVPRPRRPGQPLSSRSCCCRARLPRGRRVSPPSNAPCAASC